MEYNIKDYNETINNIFKSAYDKDLKIKSEEILKKLASLKESDIIDLILDKLKKASLIKIFDSSIIDFEVFDDIINKICCISQHFGVDKKDIYIDTGNQLDEFEITFDTRNKIIVEVVSRETAINNAKDFSDGRDVTITDLQIDYYVKLIGDNDYYFRQL